MTHARPTAPCKLCGAAAVLQRSHIVSRWGYRRIVNTPTGAHNPVVVDEDVAVLSARQAAEHMLCRACEALIGQREQYVSTIAADATGTFPGMAQIQPIHVHDAEWRLADASALDCDALAYFAASVIWRASISARFTNVTLGTHDLAFVDYLLERASFPRDVLLLVEFMQPVRGPRIDRVIVEPESQYDGDLHLHSFAIFGMLFRLFVGRLPDVLKPFSFVANKVVLLSTGANLLAPVVSRAKAATAKGSLARRG